MKKQILFYISIGLFTFQLFLVGAKLQAQGAWEQVSGILATPHCLSFSNGLLTGHSSHSNFFSSDTGSIWRKSAQVLQMRSSGLPSYSGGFYYFLHTAPIFSGNANDKLFYSGPKGQQIINTGFNYTPSGNMGINTSYDYRRAPDGVCGFRLTTTGVGGAGPYSFRSWISLNGDENLKLLEGITARKHAWARIGTTILMGDYSSITMLDWYDFQNQKTDSLNALVGAVSMGQEFFLMNKDGNWYRYDTLLNRLSEGQIPFSQIEHIWKEDSLVFFKTPTELVVSNDLFVNDIRLVQEQPKPASTLIKSAGPFHFCTNGTIIWRRTGTLGSWERIPFLGFNLANPGPMSIRGDTLLAYTKGYKLCGNVFEKAANIDPVPDDIYVYKNYWFRQKASNLRLQRSSDQGKNWTGLPTVVNHFGEFMGCGDRLYFYGDSSSRYSDNNGQNWQLGTWGTDYLICSGTDTLVRQILGTSDKVYSIDGGNSWNMLPIPHPYRQLLLNKRGLFSINLGSNYIRKSLDWGQTWDSVLATSHTQPGLIYAAKFLAHDSLMFFMYPEWYGCQTKYYVSTNWGQNWKQLHRPPFYSGRIGYPCNGYPYTELENRATGAFVFRDYLYVNTEYSGLWRRTIDNLSNVRNEFLFDEDIALCPGAFTVIVGDTIRMDTIFMRLIENGPDDCTYLERKRVHFTPLPTVQFDTIVANGSSFLGQLISSDTVLTFNYTSAEGCDSTVQWNVVSQLSSIDELKKQEAESLLKVFPNPNNGILFLQTASSVKKRVRLLDMTGRIILDRMVRSAQEQIDMKTMPSGAYFLQVIFENGDIRSQKVLKL